VTVIVPDVGVKVNAAVKSSIAHSVLSDSGRRGRGSP